MYKVTIYSTLLVALFSVACQAQPPATKFRESFLPEPGDFVPRMFRETEEDRKRLARVKIEPKEEAQLGRRLVGWFVKSLKRQDVDVEDRGKDVEYLRSLVTVLRPRMRQARRYRKINVLLADSDVADARSFPGGTIIFSRGMLEFSESEAAIVGVLGHELSHIDRGHLLNGLRRQKLAQQTFSSGRVSPREFMSTGKLWTAQFTQPFHPEQETEADEDAIRWMVAAGYDPLEMAKFFQRMHDRDPRQGRFLPRFLQTHPFPLERFNAVNQLADALTAKTGGNLYVGRENLKRRLPKHKRRFPE